MIISWLYVLLKGFFDVKILIYYRFSSIKNLILFQSWRSQLAGFGGYAPDCSEESAANGTGAKRLSFLFWFVFSFAFKRKNEHETFQAGKILKQVQNDGV